MSTVNEYRVELDENSVPTLSVRERYKASGKFNDPLKIVDFSRSELRLDKMAEEYVYLFCMDNANHLLGVFEISHGNVNSSMANSREIFQRALLCGATAIIMVHNHPSGDTTPSTDDINTTERVKKAGRLMNVELLDHIIIGKDMCSLREEGII